MASLADILAYKAAEDAEAMETAQSVGTIAGAALGGLTGVDVGNVELQLKNRMRGMLNPPVQQLQSSDLGIHRLKPGPRLAGGLVGLAVGGGLGSFAAKQVMGESDAARLLAKAQVQQSLSPVEMQRLENLITESYASGGVV